VAEAAPFPVLGSIAQSTLDRIAVNVAQFLDELWMIANVEIVITFLPEMLGAADQPPGMITYP
jgi:hypothetical protein